MSFVMFISAHRHYDFMCYTLLYQKRISLHYAILPLLLQIYCPKSQSLCFIAFQSVMLRSLLLKAMPTLVMGRPSRAYLSA